ncbi:MAG: hypothetical protein WA116_04315 [Anaerolineaceae bacterium]
MVEAINLIKDGKDLELLVASYFQASDYYVDCNLKWVEDKDDLLGKIDVCEIDILAKVFCIHPVKTTLIECKRGCKYDDLLKFSGVANLIAADNNIMVCQSHDISHLKRVGKEINIQVKTLEELLLELTTEQKDKFSFYYAANCMSNLLLNKEIIIDNLSSSGKFSDDEQEAYNDFRKFMAELIGKIWKEPDLVKQSIQIKSLLDTHSDFVRKIARQLNIKPRNKNSEYYMNINRLCQAAGFLVLKVKVSYVICAVQCAIALENGVSLSLDKVNDKSFVSVVNLARNNLAVASKIPLFLQDFIYIFGGMVSLIDKDLDNIAQYMKTTSDELRTMISLLKRLFYKLTETEIQWGFVEDMSVLSLKYVPVPLKAIGLVNREHLGYPITGFCFANQWKRSLDIYPL